MDDYGTRAARKLRDAAQLWMDGYWRKDIAMTVSSSISRTRVCGRGVWVFIWSWEPKRDHPTTHLPREIGKWTVCV
jgi:hypothetical protein